MLNKIKLIILFFIIFKYEGFVVVDCKIIVSESLFLVYFVKYDNKYIIIFKFLVWFVELWMFWSGRWKEYGMFVVIG